jgi:hypothetical protein
MLHAKENNMAEIVKFIYVMIFFLFMLLVSTNVDGKLFLSFSYFFFTSNKIFHSILVIFFFFSIQRPVIDVQKILNVYSCSVAIISERGVSVHNVDVLEY